MILGLSQEKRLLHSRHAIYKDTNDQQVAESHLTAEPRSSDPAARKAARDPSHRATAPGRSERATPADVCRRRLVTGGKPSGRSRLRRSRNESRHRCDALRMDRILMNSANLVLLERGSCLGA